MTQAEPKTSPLKRETALLLACLAFGLLCLPVAIYAVGTAIFGEFTGGGFRGFFSVVHRDLRDLDTAAWFLVVSPYLVIQLLRATVGLFRHARAD